MHTDISMVKDKLSKGIIIVDVRVTARQKLNFIFRVQIRSLQQSINSDHLHPLLTCCRAAEGLTAEKTQHTTPSRRLYCDAAPRKWLGSSPYGALWRPLSAFNRCAPNPFTWHSQFNNKRGAAYRPPRNPSLEWRRFIGFMPVHTVERDATSRSWAHTDRRRHSCTLTLSPARVSARAGSRCLKTLGLFPPQNVSRSFRGHLLTFRNVEGAWIMLQSNQSRGVSRWGGACGRGETGAWEVQGQIRRSQGRGGARATCKPASTD